MSPTIPQVLLALTQYVEKKKKGLFNWQSIGHLKEVELWWDLLSDGGCTDGAVDRGILSNFGFVGIPKSSSVIKVT